MKKYHISINGTDFGIYQGNSKKDALDALARDAGYEDYKAAPGGTYGDNVDIVEVI